jgi:hypothetical protein
MNHLPQSKKFLASEESRFRGTRIRQEPVHRERVAGYHRRRSDPAFFEYPHTALSRNEHETETAVERRSDQAYLKGPELTQTASDHQRKEKSHGFQ